MLIVDNASYHRQPTVPESLTLDHLPPYSPELNPIERVWKLLRRLRIHNVYFETLDHLTEEVTGQLINWAMPNPSHTEHLATIRNKSRSKSKSRNLPPRIGFANSTRGFPHHFDESPSRIRSSLRGTQGCSRDDNFFFFRRVDSERNRFIAFK